jgi:NAD-dependent SIR2 family protein deacetylase
MSVAVSTSSPTEDRRPPAADLDALRQFLRAHSRIYVLTGAGCSTESGIPDYRNADGSWKRRQPVQFAAFMRDPSVRARYWARSLVGWRRVNTAAPNDCHRALAQLERAGGVSLLATQNVDGLHQAAGSQRVIDLHGRIDRVACMSCHREASRESWQQRLEACNADWSALDAPAAPDGDADLDGPDFDGFDVPFCPHCGGIVKPDVVFFGESIPPWRHAQATAALETSDAMLVVGTSLMVHSGYRYALAAHRLTKPIAAVNLGATRADALFALKVEAPAGQTLAAAIS